MKVVICTDIEGVAGVVDFPTQAYGDGKYYEEAKKLLTAEVNAAVDALVEEGIDDIIVNDGHGPGGIHFPSLHPAAKLAHGRPMAPRYIRNEIFREYDVTMMIGQHAMMGVQDANLNHTQNSRIIEWYKLNGRLIGEIAQWSLASGALGLPMIFLSGDEAACREAEELIPGITTAAVKKGLSRSYAISLSQVESHRRIREGVRQAIQKQRTNPLPPLHFSGPYVLEKRFLFSNDIDRTEMNPMYERIDERTVRLKSDDILKIIYA